MSDEAKLRERFFRDPLPTRLGGLAATLARVSSSARASGSDATVTSLLNEAKYFIEWTAAETNPEDAAELAQIQVQIALWERAWDTASSNKAERTLLSMQAKLWSDKALEISGLL